MNLRDSKSLDLIFFEKQENICENKNYKKPKKNLVGARFELARVSPWELKSHALDQLGHPTLNS